MKDTIRNRQTDKVLKYLKDNGSIDQIRAMNELGVMRLGARIWDLKARGIAIKTDMKKGVNSEGYRTSWAEYKLAEPDKVRY